MKHIFKWLFISILLLSSLAAAVFMILESGSFYQTLYESESHFYGYWAAALNEIFMGIMAAVWITKRDKHGKQQSHLINYFFKLLLVILFITTISGASYYVASPIITNIQNQKNQSRILNIIDSQIANNKKSLEIFSSQNQKMNTALAAKRTWESQQQAKSIIGGNQYTFVLWFQLIIVILLRFGIQSSNLGCVWLAGWLYRKPAYKIETEDQKSVLQSLNNREINTKPKIQAIRNNKINTGIRTKTDPRVNLYKQQDIRKREVFDRQDNINIIRKQIVNYLNLRNEGILMRDIAQAVGVSEKSMLDIQNNKISSLHFDAKNLETILKKFKIVFDQESASSF
ncbi:MAG: hypothetical protein HOD92_02675 [Deltaproteobacteria bacterium]|jgi:hypothetical protein|nr:hypothetical protein [Deltaproteobacteria bacterium]MBT4527373.1 hypothetical protein [Deltaproteobacteria bacterium]